MSGRGSSLRERLLSHRAADRTGVWAGTAAVVGAALAGILVFGPRPPSDDQVDFLVVRKDLPVWTVLDESAMRSHLGRARERRERLPPGAVTDERLVQGKTALRNIRAGEYLTDTDVGRPIRDFFPDDGPRAYSVQLGPDDRGADALRPGDRVDLAVVVRVGGGRVTSEPVLKGLLVLAANSVDNSLAVAVTPAQAEVVRAAEYRGNLRAKRVGGAD